MKKQTKTSVPKNSIRERAKKNSPIIKRLVELELFKEKVEHYLASTLVKRITDHEAICEIIYSIKELKQEPCIKIKR